MAVYIVDVAVDVLEFSFCGTMAAHAIQDLYVLPRCSLACAHVHVYCECCCRSFGLLRRIVLCSHPSRGQRLQCPKDLLRMLSLPKKASCAESKKSLQV